jgi:hypothetical protein
MEVCGLLQVLVDFSSLTTPDTHRIEEWMGAGIFDLSRSRILKRLYKLEKALKQFCVGVGVKITALSMWVNPEQLETMTVRCCRNLVGF